jgi:hypothetical protein
MLKKGPQEKELTKRFDLVETVGKRNRGCQSSLPQR